MSLRKTPRVLIVDDDPAGRECYGRLFRRHGYQTLLAPNGSWVERNRQQIEDPEVILLDYRMPGMTGLELLEKLRGEGFTGAAFLISAHVSEEMFSEAARLGIRRVFHKPVESAVLMESVAEALTHFERKASASGKDANALI